MDATPVKGTEEADVQVSRASLSYAYFFAPANEGMAVLDEKLAQIQIRFRLLNRKSTA